MKQIDLSIDNYVLYRVEDNMSLPLKSVGFIINGNLMNGPMIGSSIVGNPNEGMCSYVTTPIVKIVSDNEYRMDGATYRIYEL